MAEYATGDGYIAALIAAQRRSRDREDSTRIGCPMPPNPIIGKDEDIQDANPQPPSYDTLDIQPRVPVTSELNENPLWQLVENDLRRDVNIDDPLKGARRVGRKPIAAMYFPLLNDGVHFIWSLLQAIILFVIMVPQFNVVFDSHILPNCSRPINNTQICDPIVTTADISEVLSF